MVHKKAAIQNILEQNTTNMVFYEDSFAKTAFFTKEILQRKYQTGKFPYFILILIYNTLVL